MSMRRGQSSQRRPAQAILIVCEGRNTEPCYFAVVKEALRLAPQVDIYVEGRSGYTDPAGLIQAAVVIRDKRKREAKRSSVLRAFDQVWVVFDTESPGQRPTIPSLIAPAQQEGLELAISRPSFEVWYLLHEKRQLPHVETQAMAFEALKVLLSGYEKSKQGAALAASWSLAEHRLAKALAHAEAQEPFQPPCLPERIGSSLAPLLQALIANCTDRAALARLGLTPV